jgi:fibronectin-binding autotransporter adhesin
MFLNRSRSNSVRTAKPARSTGRRVISRPPQIEALEDRCMPVVRTWTGALSALWSNPGNWSPGGAPVSNDSLIFPAGAVRTGFGISNDLTPNLTFTRVDISTNYGLIGNSIIIGSGGVHFLSTTTRAEIFMPLNLSFSNTVFEVAGPGTGGQGELALRGIIGGVGGMSKTGTGTLQILVPAANTYQGATNVLGGVLAFARGTDFGTNPGTAVTVIAGASLDMGAGADVFTKPLSLNGSGVSGTGALRVSVAGLHTWRANVTLASLPTINVMLSNGQLNLLGQISGTAGLIKIGPGTMAFTGTGPANTYTGTTRVSAGTLLLSKLNVPAVPRNLEVFGGTAPVVRLGNHLQTAASTVVDLGTNGVFDLNGFVTGIAGLLTTGGDVSTGAGTLAIGAQGIVKRAGGNLGLITGNVQLTLAAGPVTVLEPNPALGVSIAGTTGGPGALIKTGLGTLVLRGTANNAHGATEVRDGTLVLDKSPGVTAVPGALVVRNPIFFTPSAVVRWNAADQVADAASVTVNTAGHLLLNGHADAVAAVTVNGGNVTLGGGGLVMAGNYVQTAGRTTLSDGYIVATLVDLQGGVLDGNGLIFGNLRNAGQIDVGGAGTPGYLFVVGDYTQTASGVLNIDLGGTELATEYDILLVDGNATLAGTMNVSRIGGYVPNPDDLFLPVYTTGPCAGEFNSITGLTIPPDRELFPFYFGNGLLLIAV